MDNEYTPTKPKFSLENFELVNIPEKYYQISLFGKRLIFCDRQPTFGHRIVVIMPGPHCGLFCSCSRCRLAKATSEVLRVHGLSLYGIYNPDEISNMGDLDAKWDDEVAKTAEKAAGVIRIVLPSVKTS